MMAARHRPSASSGARAGFALPTVLTVTTILTLIFLVCIVALKGLTDQVRAAGDDVELQRHALSAEAQVEFLAVTQPFGPTMIKLGGHRTSTLEMMTTGKSAPSYEDRWTPLLLDGRDYLWRPTDGGAEYRLALQDEAGLINIDTAAPPVVAQVFQAAGVSAQDAARLTSELRDYVSIDGSVIADGASAADYARAGLPPPLRRPATRLSDLLGMLNGDRLASAADWRSAGRFLTVVPDSPAQNINTAPAEVLSSLYGLAPDRARAIVQTRQAHYFADIAEIGVPAANEFQSYVFPNGHIRFTFVDPHTGSFYRSVLVLTPGDATRPIWVEDPTTQRGVRPADTQRVSPAPFPALPN